MEPGDSRAPGRHPATGRHLARRPLHHEHVLLHGRLAHHADHSFEDAAARLIRGILRSMSSKQDGIDARNRDFVRYEQVDKKQDYRLAEATGAQAVEEFDEEFRIRTCDLGRWLSGGESDRRGFAEELGRALEEIGFAIL